MGFVEKSESKRMTALFFICDVWNWLKIIQGFLERDYEEETYMERGRGVGG